MLVVMKISFRSLTVVSAASLALLAACNTSPKPEDKKQPAAVATAEAKADLVKRGEALVKMGGCSDCHTPMQFDPKIGMPVPQMDRFLSGHPEGAPDPSGNVGKGDQAVIGPTFTSFKLPFGVTYAQNLTPDPETGLRMDKDAFIRTMRSGRHRGEANGRPVLPPMPWMNLSTATESDLEAMHAYLGSIAPVKNRVPENKVPKEVMDEIAKAYGQVAAR